MDKKSMLYKACRLGHLEIVKHLVSKGANIHAYDNYALRYASFSLHNTIYIVDSLIG